MQTLRMIGLLLAVAVAVSGFHLKEARVMEKVGDFLRKKTKFGDVYLHR